jgi:hypothetical protein
VDIFAVKGRDEGLVQFDEEMVGDFIAFVLDGLDDLHLLGNARVVREHFEEGHREIIGSSRSDFQALSSALTPACRHPLPISLPRDRLVPDQSRLV